VGQVERRVLKSGTPEAKIPAPQTSLSLSRESSGRLQREPLCAAVQRPTPTVHAELQQVETISEVHKSRCTTYNHAACCNNLFETVMKVVNNTMARAVGCSALRQSRLTPTSRRHCQELSSAQPTQSAHDRALTQCFVTAGQQGQAAGQPCNTPLTKPNHATTVAAPTTCKSIDQLVGQPKCSFQHKLTTQTHPQQHNPLQSHANHCRINPVPATGVSPHLARVKGFYQPWPARPKPQLMPWLV